MAFKIVLYFTDLIGYKWYGLVFSIVYFFTIELRYKRYWLVFTPQEELNVHSEIHLLILTFFKVCKKL